MLNAHDEFLPLRHAQPSKADTTADPEPRGMLVSPVFWLGGVMSLGIWALLLALAHRFIG